MTFAQGEGPPRTCVPDHTQDMGGVAAMRAPKVCRSSDAPRSLEPNSGLPCTEGCLCHAVLREAREEPLERPLPDLIVDRCSTVFLQDCVAGMWLIRLTPRRARSRANGGGPDVGKAKLDALVCLAQELVRDADSNSECDAAGGNCGRFG